MMAYPCRAASSSALSRRSSLPGPTFTISAPRPAVDSSLMEGAGRVGDPLGMIAAGVGDDSAGAFLIPERSDLVVGAAQLKSADGLKVFEFEEEAARAGVAAQLRS